MSAGRGDAWNEASWAVVDIETTGLRPDRDELLSFGVVAIDGGRIQAGAALYRLVRPLRMPDEQTIVIHGIRPADVAGAPAVGEVLDELIEALAGRAMVAHVASVERAFLAPLLRDRGRRLPAVVADTAALGRLWMAENGMRPSSNPLELGELARALGLPVHRPHHALGDALTTAQVFLALATHLSARRPQTVAMLGRAERRVRRARYDWSGPSRR
jgi:DNA polymerase-3 subunit epsilon